ncbi:acetylxylan esterase [Micromonospora sp. DT201]|uniref:acetylxylan esterase n=1 Tax=Micromonospora sp. DT201 TaxID=3393442 RepID=UPI003CE6A3D2
MPNSPLFLDGLEQYSPTVDEPDDFDRFWRDTLAEATARPVLVDVRPEPTDLRLLDSWDVTFAGFGGDPVRAWYTRPTGPGSRFGELTAAASRGHASEAQLSHSGS